MAMAAAAVPGPRLRTAPCSSSPRSRRHDILGRTVTFHVGVELFVLGDVDRVCSCAKAASPSVRRLRHRVVNDDDNDLDVDDDGAANREGTCFAPTGMRRMLRLDSNFSINTASNPASPRRNSLPPIPWRPLAVSTGGACVTRNDWLLNASRSACSVPRSASSMTLTMDNTPAVRRTTPRR